MRQNPTDRKKSATSGPSGSTTKKRRKHRVAVVIGSDPSLFEMAVATEIFGFDRPELGVDWYDFKICNPEPGPVDVLGHLTLSTPFGLREIQQADTIVVTPTMDRRCCDPLTKALQTAHKKGKRIVSLCSGVFSLAGAGIVDNLEVTTHWKHTAELREKHPSVRVDPNVLFVENENIYTSAGSAASIDLCLHIVRLDYGAEIANMVARGMVVPPQRDGGQAQYVEHPINPKPGAALFADTLAWAEANLAAQITVEDLAERSAMSPRTFARRFKATAGTTPHHWLTQQRLQLAQRLLETTEHSIDYVADQSGFGTAANLRTHFQRNLATTPSRYRSCFTVNC